MSESLTEGERSRLYTPSIGEQNSAAKAEPEPKQDAAETLGEILRRKATENYMASPVFAENVRLGALAYIQGNASDHSNPDTFARLVINAWKFGVMFAEGGASNYVR